MSSAPEIQTGFTPVGRETLAAIAEELASGGPHREPQATIRDDLEEELTSARERQITWTFEQQALAPRAEGPPRTTEVGGFAPNQAFALSRVLAAPDRRPQVTVRAGVPASVATPGQPALAPGTGAAGEEAFDLYEMVTFVVRGDLAQLSSLSARREFVRSHLRHRLPVRDFADVDRIDVTPWTVHGTVIVRVWCRIAPPDGSEPRQGEPAVSSRNAAGR